MAVVACLLCAPVVARSAEVNARLDRDTIYLGTQTLLVIEVENDAGKWPEIGAVDGVVIRRYGSPSIMHDLMSGRVQRSYRFLVSPQRAGTFHIPAVTLQVGEETVQRGPFALRVIEAPVKCLGAKLDPDETVVGRMVTLVVGYQGYKPGARPQVPQITGLTITPLGEPQTDLDATGLPQILLRFRVTPSRLGTFRIAGITFAGAAAAEVTLTVSPFVVVRVQTSDQSLTVGQQAELHFVTLGLAADARPMLVAPAGLKITPSGQPRQDSRGETTFSYIVSASEPGSPTINTLKLGDGRQVPLKRPITFSVRQGGEGGILSFSGKARSDETALGEPFIVDYDLIFRGDLRGAAVDLSKAGFADKAYIKVEPVNDLKYPDWTGQPLQINLLPDGRITALVGSGDYEGQKEQRMRFALKITPLAAGEVPLTGVRAIVRLHISSRQQSPGFIFQSEADRDFEETVDLPPHRVVDPRGKKAPPGYRGAVGASFTFETSLDRTTAAAMSPLTLTMKITGESVGPQSQPPALAEVQELTRDFELSPSVQGGEVEGNTITFTQTIRPRTERVRELPSLPLVFYNYQKQQYETVYSLPIPLEVVSGSVVGAEAMQTAVGTQPAPEFISPAATQPAETQGRISLGANFSTLGSVARREPLGPVGLLAVLIGCPAGVVLVRAGYLLYLRRRPASEVRRQRARLLASLHSLRDTDRFHGELAEHVQAFLRLSLGLPPGEISAHELERLLEHRRADGDLRRAAMNLLAECDAGRFAAGLVGQAERDRLIGQAREVLRKIEQLEQN